jgi:hypothetical protein
VAPGFTRCRLHGGDSPLARQAAQETLAAAALPAAAVLFDILDQWRRTKCPVCGMPTGDPSPVIRAATAVLDRTGLGPSASLSVSSPGQEPRDYAYMRWLTDAELDQFEAMCLAAERRMEDAEGAIDAEAFEVPEPAALEERPTPLEEPTTEDPSD